MSADEKPEKTLLVNAIITPDGTKLESKHRHDYVSHQDKNGETYFLDGGTSYIRGSLNKEPATNACLYLEDPHELIREHVKWGTRGKNFDQPLEYKTVASLESSHIEKILTTCAHMSTSMRTVLANELKHRKHRKNKKL
jgi:hypothetical protein